MKKVVKGINDLATKNPELAQEWHPTRNVDLTPFDVSAHSNKKVWWLGQCGHEWEAVIASRSNGRGCPYCVGRLVLVGYNDLKTTFPDIAKEWNEEKNFPQNNTDVSSGSHYNAWWKCSKCGHEWQAEVKTRTSGEGCPKCAY